MNEAVTPPPPQQTAYDLIGGAVGLRHLVDIFYDTMDSDPAAAGIRAMHGADLGPMREKLFEWLSGWLGGPPLYMQRPDRACMMSAHSPYAIGTDERDQWLACMRHALGAAGLPEPTRQAFENAFQLMAERFRSR